MWSDDLGSQGANPPPAWSTKAIGVEGRGSHHRFAYEASLGTNLHSEGAYDAGTTPLPESRTAAAPEIRHEARIFLRELQTQRYLSVVQKNRSVEPIMTERPVSLFVTHLNQDDSLGFEHEGLPALGKFLSAGLLELVSSWVGVESHSVSCDGGLGRSSDFKWHPDATLQHVSSGLWLYVDPAKPDVLMLHKFYKSQWEAAPVT
ncbi:unnamed protein product [Effrenium voratum]|uniref:Uncharacterized protein n=1 Tax=Effrenium voratum TaxID=2562239 RepID=A0AA36I4A2_9DINO|nr:unnamed protein product [Effrenium voratum]